MERMSKQGMDMDDTHLRQDDQVLLSPILDIVADVQAGKPVIIVDDEDRENEGDLIVAAEMADAEVINFMAKDGRGLICLPMEAQMVDRLGLELMGRGDNSQHRTAFTVSIEAKEGVTTGISAADRARTIQAAIDPQSGANDIATPGHVFPLRARDGGVLVRAGHTEAAVDLAKMAGFSGAGVICEIMNDDGTMARLPDLRVFAKRHDLKIGSIADLIAYRRQKECLVRCIYEGAFQAKGLHDFRLFVYANTVQYAEHVVLVKGDVSAQGSSVLVRMHSENFIDDVLASSGSSELHKALHVIEEDGCGVVVIIRDPNPYSVSEALVPTSELNKEAQGSGNVHATLRRYGIGAQILQDLGVRNMTLLTNHPKNIVGLDGYNLHIDGYKTIV